MSGGTYVAMIPEAMTMAKLATSWLLGGLVAGVLSGCSGGGSEATIGNNRSSGGGANAGGFGASAGGASGAGMADAGCVSCAAPPPILQPASGGSAIFAGTGGAGGTSSSFPSTGGASSTVAYAGGSTFVAASGGSTVASSGGAPPSQDAGTPGSSDALVATDAGAKRDGPTRRSPTSAKR